MAAAEVAVARPPHQFDRRLDAGRLGFDAHRIGEPAEDLGHLLGRRLGDADLVRDTPEVRLFQHRLRFEVRAEADRRPEREGDALAGDQRHRVFAPFEGGNPAVQQRVRRNLLPPEVVDGQQATVGLHVRRRLVVPERRVIREVEVLVAQFTADEHKRAADAQPAPVKLRGRVGGVVPFDRLVHEVVVQPDDVAAHVDGHRHQGDTLDGLARQFEDGGLAVAGGAPEHRRAAGRERKADLRDHVTREDQLLQRAGKPNRVRRADLGVALEDPEVVLDRHGHGPDVLAAAEGVLRLAQAHLGQAVLPLGLEPARRRGRLDQALAPQFVEGFPGDAGADPHRVGHANRARHRDPVERLQREVFDKPLRQAQFVDVVRGLGQRRQRAQVCGRWTRRGTGLVRKLLLHRQVSGRLGVCLLHVTFPQRDPRPGP